jgi:hypothetical protein
MKPTAINFNDVRNLVARAALTLLFLARPAGPARAQTVSEAQPAFAWHGRAVAVTVSPWPLQFVVVASESGGLFQSLDGGANFQHIDPLAGDPGADVFIRMFRMRDVKYGPAFGDGRPPILIATGWPDSSVTNEGGIWYSYDFGARWTRASYTAPCTAREGAYGIAIDPITGQLYVGTDCGLAYSLDYGTNWSLINLSPGGDSRIFSVVAHDGVWVDVLGAAGVMRGVVAKSGVAFGSPILSGSRQLGQSVHSLTVSPVESSEVFLADVLGRCWEIHYPQLQFNPSHYQPVSDVLASVGGGRDPWVAASPSVDGTSYTLYFGAGENDVLRQTITTKGGVYPRCKFGSWGPTTSHHDPNGIAFSTQPGNNCAQFLANDAGVFDTADCGATWLPIGRGRNAGYNALQIYDMAGEMVSSMSSGYHTELYIATQDNGITASGDDGKSWPTTIRDDSFHCQVARYSRGPGHNGNVITFADVNDFNDVSDPLLVSWRKWSNPILAPGTAWGNMGNPTLINWCVEHHVYGTTIKTENHSVQSFIYTNVNVNAMYITSSDGASYNLVVTDRNNWYSWPQASWNGYDITLYQAYSRPGGTIGLLRITGITADGRIGNTKIKFADNGLGSIGLAVPGEGAYVLPPVFAVDPQDPSHLIAADIQSHNMKVSTDGGASWNTDAGMQQLTDLVGRFDARTGDRYYEFDIAPSEFYGSNPPPGGGLPLVQVRAIAFDPSHKNHIMVGTETAGLFRSTDGGRTWSRVANTENMVTAVTGFFFNDANSNPNQPLDEVWIATYGRGLWKMTYPRLVGDGFVIFQVGPATLTQWDGGCWFQAPSGGCVQVTNVINSTNCPGCVAEVVVGGNITDMALDTNGYVQAVTTDAGRMVVSTADGQEVSLQHPILSSTNLGAFIGCPACSNLVLTGGNVRGLVLDHGQLKAIIGGFGVLPGETNIAQFSPPPGVLVDTPLATPPTNAYIRVIGTRSVGGQPTVGSGDTITVTGTGFCAACDPVAISIDGVVATNVTVAGDGSFQTFLTVTGAPGTHLVAAQQDSPSGPLADREWVVVAVIGDDAAGLAQPPLLAIQQQTNGLLITWSGDGYELQSNTNLNSPGSWQPLPSSQAVTIGDLKTVLVQPVEVQAFYRLALAPPPPPPAAVTLAASNVRTHGAILNGTVNGNGGNSAAWFVYGTTSNYDNSTSSTWISSADTNDVAVTMDITGLQPGTLYHFQAVAANVGGTTYGADQTFITLFPPPDAVVQTFAASSVTSNSAVLVGSVNPEGTVLAGWFQWGLDTSYGSNTPNFYNTTMNYQPVTESAVLTNLQANTTYHYRIVAYNGGPDEALGNDVSFTTSTPFQPLPPTVTTFAATAVSNSAATFNGSVNPNGAETYSYFEYGTNSYYGTTTAISDDGVGGTSVNLSYRVGNLAPNTTYHYRIAAYNSGGTSLGPDQIFTTGSGQPLPTVNTLAASSVTNNSAILNGNVNPNGLDAHSFFEYGLDTSYGGVTALSDVGSFNTPVSLSYALILAANSTYHFRIVAYNSGGTNYGADVSFTTAPSPPPPTVATLAATSITTNAAILNGSVSPNGFDTHAYFLYGLSTGYGSNTALLDLGADSSPVPLSASVNLLPSTTYHFRVFAYSSAGTSYGQDMTFTSPP